MKIIPTCPPVASLEKIGIENAKEFRKVAKEGFEKEYGHISHSVAGFLEKLNEIGDFCGVESLFPEKENIFYLNAGDTYTPTVCYDYFSHRLFVACWGDLVE